MNEEPNAIDAQLDNASANLSASGDAIGFVGADIPIEVLLATRRPFGHLPWRPAEPTAWADASLESSFPYWARSILEQWHDGAFDDLSAVVFSRAEDASQRLFYYVRELQQRGLLGGPAPRMFDIAMIPRESSLRHTAAAILELARSFDVTTAMLHEGLEKAESLREALQRIQAIRSTDGPFYERLSRAALWSNAADWIDEIVAPTERGNGMRLLLAGSAPPDDRLHLTVEAAGSCVIAEAHVHGLTRLGGPMGSGPATVERRLAEHLTSASVGPRAFLDRARWIVEQTEIHRADAVILWLTREDEALAWHVPAQSRALGAAGIPLCVLPASRWQMDDGALERVAEFCKGLIDASA